MNSLILAVSFSKINNRYYLLVSCVKQLIPSFTIFCGHVKHPYLPDLSRHLALIDYSERDLIELWNRMERTQ